MDYADHSSLRDAIRVFVRGLLPAVLVGAALAVGVYFLANARPERYEGRTTLLVVNSRSAPSTFDVSLITAPSIDADAYRAAVLSGPVLDGALRYLGVTDPSEQDRSSLVEATDVEVVAMDESSLVALVTSASSPEMAASRANALAQSLLEWDQRRAVRTLSTIVQTLQAQIDALDDQVNAQQQAGAPQPQIDSLLSQRNDYAAQLNSARALMTSAVGRLEVLDPAALPSEPESNRATLLAAAAFLLGAFVVYAFLVVRNAIDTRIRTIADFSETTGVPVISGFDRPRPGEHGLDGETANYLRAHLLPTIASEKPLVVVVTSATKDTARSQVAVGLAESISRSGMSTLLIDANMRQPGASLAYRAPARSVPELEEYLVDASLELSPLHVATSDGSMLHVVPNTGSSYPPSELLGRSFATRLEQWKPHFDAIVVDTPPVLEVADVLSVAPFASGVLMVADLRGLTRRSARMAVQAFDRLGVRILGAAVYGAMDDQETRGRSAGASMVRRRGQGNEKRTRTVKGTRPSRR